MQYSINNTESYHIEEMETLGWELTVCNSLEPANSPIRPLLKHNATYGNLLCAFLQHYLDFTGIKSIVEIGGGYGYLMRDILSHYAHIAATMIDISPFLLEKQQQSLKKFKVNYIHKDFFAIAPTVLAHFDLALLNENVGDFPTICGITGKMLNEGKDNTLQRVAELIKKYNLDIPRENDIPFNFNLGAVEAVENLCQAHIRHIFLSEHSCEAQTPFQFQGKIHIAPHNNPERIRLRGHDEYTIRFSHLTRIAQMLGYTIKRGNFLDFIEIEQNSALHYILTSNSSKDEHEIIRHFIEDLIKYEYIVLQK